MVAQDEASAAVSRTRLNEPRLMFSLLTGCGKIWFGACFDICFSSFVRSTGLIFGVLGVSESNSKLSRTHFGLDLQRRSCSHQVAHAHQIVSGAGEGEQPMHFAHSAMPHLPHQRDSFQPAEAFFDSLPLSLAHGVARVPRDAAIDRATARPRMILCHMRRHPQIPALFHKVPRVESLIATHRYRLSAGK